MEWPPARQPLLAGEYSGKVRDGWQRDGACEFLSARLRLSTDKTYVLDLHCAADATGTRMLRGTWWIDEIAGSCVILVDPQPVPTRDDRLFGFRVIGDADALRQDGGGCQAADERDEAMVLVRTGASSD
ncbi:hypothetical protein E2F46_00790 [Luteimonas aestuarii]|uniref:Copper resistance protein NlpE n=1 Tax=Luteimonas aestuarii TaxID=453837 RepID=A0A4R5U407_9GAMM|nr:hypothetical protein [Luteimonas aestuarii]TDK28462.1 hypothetical protein E2F46_00790 [Luteimonas aestuarii]